MAIHITPEIMEAMYELLRRTKPFCAWKLPEPDDVEFVVLRTKHFCARHWLRGATHIIEISSAKHSTLITLTEAMAHEMCHMREMQLGVRADVEHGRTFQRLADQVCRHHQYDRRAF